MIYKWLLKGHGHIVADYAEGRKNSHTRKLSKTIQTADILLTAKGTKKHEKVRVFRAFRG